MTLDFSRCRNVWVPDDSEAGGFWSPPLPHVKFGVEWLIAHPYALLGDDMGGMKTAQTIIAAQFLSEMDVIDRVIVVAPAAVRPKVWFDQDLGQLNEQLWRGKRSLVCEYHARVRKWVHEPEGTNELRWIVTNYEFIRTKANLHVLLDYCGPKTLLVLDESSAVRGHDSAQTDACMTLRWLTNRRGRPVLGAARCGRILLLNGTPVAESPMDMFSQGNLMHPSILECKYVTHYKARYAITKPVYGKKDRRGNWVQAIEGWHNLEDLQRRFAPYVLRREAKDLGIDFALPSVPLEVRLTEATWRVYRQMRDEMVVWLKSGVATSATAAVKSLRLAQITSGFLGGVEDANIGDSDGFTFDGDDDPLPRDSGGARHAPRPVVEIGREKLDFALAWHAERLEHDPNLKLTSWCRFVPELRRYLNEVKRFGHPVGAACGAKVFEGEHSQKSERETALRLLHPKTAPEGPATVGATQGTGALGLNFTACHTVLEISYDYSSFKKKQGDSRFNRPGQRQMVSFH